MTPTRVETRLWLSEVEIMATRISKPRDVSLCNEKEVTYTLRLMEIHTDKFKIKYSRSSRKRPPLEFRKKGRN